MPVLGTGKKNPRLPVWQSGIAPFFLDPWRGVHPAPEMEQPTTPQAGLLTSGSSYSLRLPVRRAASSGIRPVTGTLQVSSPATAAGPRSIETSFPFDPEGDLRLSHQLKERI
jgi:hypothetical protein